MGVEGGDVDASAEGAAEASELATAAEGTGDAVDDEDEAANSAPAGGPDESVALHAEDAVEADTAVDANI